MVTTKRDKAIIRRLREIANFVTASFNDVGKRTVRIQVLDEKTDEWKTVEAGDFIKERTRLYRDTYLDPLLDELDGKGPCFDEKVDIYAKEKS